MEWTRVVVTQFSLTLMVNSAPALRYKALRGHKAVLAHKVQLALRVPQGRKVQLAQLAHKVQPVILALQAQWVQSV